MRGGPRAGLTEKRARGGGPSERPNDERSYGEVGARGGGSDFSGCHPGREGRKPDLDGFGEGGECEAAFGFNERNALLTREAARTPGSHGKTATVRQDVNSSWVLTLDRRRPRAGGGAEWLLGSSEHRVDGLGHAPHVSSMQSPD